MATRKRPGVHIVTNTSVHNGKTYHSHLLRRSYRENGKVKKQTLANLSHLPEYAIEILRRALGGEILVPVDRHTAGRVVRTIPHGHAAAVLGVIKNLGLDRIIASRRSSLRDRCVCLIADRIMSSGSSGVSKLATARGISKDNPLSTLGDMLGLGDVTAEEFYEAMDWLGARQGRIEKALAKRHLRDGALILYDVSSSYMEGSCCPLAARGYSRDGKKNKLQIVYGLLCTDEGYPVAVEVFEGNTSDPRTLGAQIRKVRQRFGLERVVLVADRGMLTTARINEEIRPVEGLDWISALKGNQIKKLAKEQGPLQRSLFDETDIASVYHPDFPGERLVACLNPFMQHRRRKKREELLCATEKELDKIVAATTREKRTLRGSDRIGVRVGKVINRFKMAKHFETTITDESFEYRRRESSIESEAALDGIYVIRTSVSEELLEDETAVRAYKNLKNVEKAFRCIKTVDLNIRPIYHRLEARVRAHVFICVLAYYVEWHMRRAWAPLMFSEDDLRRAESLRNSEVGPAVKSESAKRKAGTKKTADGMPVHSFDGLIKQMATLTRATKEVGGVLFHEVVPPTELQDKALELLGVRSLL